MRADALLGGSERAVGLAALSDSAEYIADVIQTAAGHDGGGAAGAAGGGGAAAARSGAASGVGGRCVGVAGQSEASELAASEEALKLCETIGRGESAAVPVSLARFCLSRRRMRRMALTSASVHARSVS